jgi:uncharacterized radical SAM superfamily Fe-S cluster-containing enzyme
MQECGCGGEGGGTVFLGTSRGMCRQCRRQVEVRYLSEEGKVFLERRCPEHGTSRALVAESLAWFLEALRAPIASRPPPRAIEKRAACPEGCGPCTFHAQRCNLPVLSITNACDLRCPICFTFNRTDQAYFMSPDEFSRHVDFVVEATGGTDLINITGGEPTLHPELLEILARARRPEIGRVTVNTNGLNLARRPELAKALADAGAYVILSLDTLDPKTSVRVHGRDLTAEKRAALENLGRCGVQTTLLMVLIGGVNEGELGAILELFEASPFVRSLTIQTMTYTGQGGGLFQPRAHLPVDGVERRIEEASGGRLRAADFLPLPTAHPLCYGASYLLSTSGGALVPFAKLLSREAIAEHLSQGYLMRPGERLEGELRAAIDRLWSEGKDPQMLSALRELLTEVYPAGRSLSAFERQRLAEQKIKTVYVHAHMDEDTYEVGRAMRCPDQVPVHAERLVGACNYNLFYRQKDPRFWVEP